MQNAKLRLIMALFALVALASSTAGCVYAGVATTSDGNVVITKNVLGGLSRHVYVCKVTSTGVANCQDTADAP